MDKKRIDEWILFIVFFIGFTTVFIYVLQATIKLIEFLYG